MTEPFHKKIQRVLTAPAPAANPGLLHALLALLAAVCCGVGVSYYWRVFYYLDSRVSPLVTTLGCVAFFVVCLGAAALLRRALKSFAAKGTVCILLCGLLFVFANPPLQTPDESTHYLRTYAISQGRLDFDAERQYPDDVAALCNAFPGSWVNAHTSIGLDTNEETGDMSVINTTGYAIKMFLVSDRVESIADAFTDYFERRDITTVTEPVSFLVLPFLPGALGMAVARLLGLAALGCMYGGRIGNLLAYTALCWLALKKAERCKPALLCVMLLPISLFMGASLSYDATLLACYYLMLALLTRRNWDTRTVALYTLACVYVNISKPYINLLWVFLLLIITKDCWHAKGSRRQWIIGMLAAALCATLLVEWYGTAFRYNYFTIPRQGGDEVSIAGQLMFVLKNPLRTIAAFWGTLYENDFFIGQTGVFGWLDVSIKFINLTGPLIMLCGALFSTAPNNELGRRRTVGLGIFGAIYSLGAVAAMYITFTPVGMVRVIGLQARYFLHAFMILMLCAAVPLRRVLRPTFDNEKIANFSVLLFGGYAALAAMLLFQAYYVGPIYIFETM